MSPRKWVKFQPDSAIGGLPIQTLPSVPFGKATAPAGTLTFQAQSENCQALCAISSAVRQAQAALFYEFSLEEHVPQIASSIWLACAPIWDRFTAIMRFGMCTNTSMGQ